MAGHLRRPQSFGEIGLLGGPGRSWEARNPHQRRAAGPNYVCMYVDATL